MKIKLNLISSKRKEEIKERKSFRFALRQGVEVLILIVFLIVSFLSFQWILRIEMGLAEDSLNYDSKKSDFEKIVEYDKTFEEANNILSDYEKIGKDQLNWSILLEKISSSTPSGITLNGLVTKNFQVSLSGESLDRDILIGFKEDLEREECFENVNLPLSNLVSRNNVDFQIEFYLNEECIKKQ